MQGSERNLWFQGVDLDSIAYAGGTRFICWAGIEHEMVVGGPNDSLPKYPSVWVSGKPSS